MGADDLMPLPPAVQAAARVLDNGEVMWPAEQAEEAVVALADAGLIVLGLDVRDYSGDGGFVEVAWSSFDPSGEDDAARSRDAALEALRRSPLPGDWVLVTWQRA